MAFFSLLFQAKHMAKEKTETGSWQCISREDSRVWALCQTGGHQGYLAATFQVRHEPCNPFVIQLKCHPSIDNSHLSSKDWCPLSFCSPALTSMSEPRGRKTQPASQEDKVVHWWPAQCTTWHTACTCTITGWRVELPPLKRSARKDTAGGVDPSQHTWSH